MEKAPQANSLIHEEALREAARNWLGASRQVDVWHSKPVSAEDQWSHLKTELELRQQMYRQEEHLLDLVSSAPKAGLHAWKTVLPEDLRARLDAALARWSHLSFRAPSTERQKVAGFMALSWALWNDDPTAPDGDHRPAPDVEPIVKLWEGISEEFDVLFARILREHRLVGSHSPINVRALPPMDIEELREFDTPEGDPVDWTVEEASSRSPSADDQDWLRAGVIVFHVEAMDYATLAHMEDLARSHWQSRCAAMSNSRLRIELMDNLDAALLRADHLRWGLFVEQVAKMISSDQATISQTLLRIERDSSGVPLRISSVTLALDDDGETLGEMPAFCELGSDEWLWAALRPWLALTSPQHTLRIEQADPSHQDIDVPHQGMGPDIGPEWPSGLPMDWFTAVPESGDTQH